MSRRTWVEHGAARGDLVDGLDQEAAPFVGDALLERVADAVGAVLEQLRGVALLDVLRQQVDAGSSRRIARAAWGLVEMLGGIEMSMMATSGR